LSPDDIQELENGKFDHGGKEGRSNVEATIAVASTRKRISVSGTAIPPTVLIPSRYPSP